MVPRLVNVDLKIRSIYLFSQTFLSDFVPKVLSDNHQKKASLFGETTKLL